MMSPRAAVAMASFMALLATSDVFGQEATPAPGEDDGSRAVSAAECAAEPTPIDALTNSLGLDAEGAPRPAIPTISAPLGEVVETAMAISIKEAVREVLACFNAGDIPRAASLMTEQGMRRSYWALTVDQAAREALKERIAAPPRPREAEQALRLVAVTDVSLMPDGRMAAFVIVNDPLLPPPGPETLLFLFARQDDVWLLDDWVDFSIVPTEAALLPSAAHATVA